MIAPDLAKELAHALAIAGAIFALVRFRPDRIGVVALMLMLAGCVYFGNPSARVYSHGGFWHHSIAYEILNGRVPPNDPLAAGDQLRYPWGPHLLAALVSSFVRVTPPTAFVALALGCLGATVLGLFRVAGALELAPVTAVFAVTLALFGITPLNVGAFAARLQPLLPVAMDFRGTPAFAAFTTVDGSSFGILCFVWTLDSLLRARSLSLALAIAGGFFFAPVLGIGALGAAVAAIGSLALQGAERRQVLGAGAALVAGLLLALPYLWQIGGTGFAIETGAQPILEDAVRYALTSAFAIALTLFKTAEARGAIVIRAAAAATALLYVFGRVPLGADYAFQMLSAIALGLLAAPAIGALYERRAPLSFLVVAMLLVPLSTDLLVKLDRSSWRITDPYVETNTVIDALDPAEHLLYAWIRAHTTPEDAFVDTWLTIPVFAERPLFLGVGWREPSGLLDGWMLHPRTIVRDLERRSADEVAAREAVVAELLYGSTPVDDAVVAKIRAEGISGHLYIVARSARQAQKLDAEPRLERVFASARAAVYRLR